MAMPNTLAKICDKIILVSFYLLFIIVPIILTPWNYELFEYNKMMMVYGLTIVVVAAWLIKTISTGEFKIRRTPFDLPLFLFLLSQILSTVFSIDVHTSIWGYYSRFHGGLLSTISYFVLFYAFVSNISDLNHLKNLLKIILSTALVVSLYGILEHFGIDKNLWVQDVQNRIFSTLGQPNWLAAYLAVLIPISMAFIINSKSEALSPKQISNTKIKNSKRFENSGFEFPNLFRVSIFDIRVLLFYLLSVIFYLTLLYTKSRSGIYAFWLVDLIFWGIIFTLRAKREVKTIISFFLITNFLFLLLTFIVGGSGLGPLEKFSLPQITSRLTHTKTIVATPIPAGQSVLETGLPSVASAKEGITESGDIRKIVWSGAWDIFKNNPILGTGVETFAFSYYKYRPIAHNTTSEWDFLYNKAHNEFLNFLATTGILGFGSWLAFIASFIWWSLKTIFKSKNKSDVIPAKAGIYTNNYSMDPRRSLPRAPTRDGDDRLLLLGLFTGWLSILVTDFFGFSVVIIGLLFFLIPAISFALMEEKSAERKFNFALSSSVQICLVGLTSLICLIGEFALIQIWRADTFFAQGYKLNRAGQITVAYEKLSAALQLNPQEPFYHDEFSYTLATLAQAAYQQKEATLAGILEQQAINQSDFSTQNEPNNVNFYKTRTRVFYSLAQIDPKYNADALNTIVIASQLAPTDPKIHYNLAILYGRSGQTSLALKALEQTIKLKPDYRDPYYALALLEKDAGQSEAAKRNLEYILQKLDPNDAEAKQKLQEWK